MTSYERVKAWRKKNKAKVTEQARRYRARHPEANARIRRAYRKRHLVRLREEDRIDQAKRRAENPEINRERYKRWRTKREAELVALAGRPRPKICELCNGFGKRRGQYPAIVFDHCHATKKFRGWLCDRCNRVLGSVHDSSSLLRKMAEYLENGGTPRSGKKKDSFK